MPPLRSQIPSPRPSRPRGRFARLARRFWWTVPATLLLIIAGLVTWYQLGLRPVGTGAAQAFTIAPGATATTVATDLAEAGLIRSRNAFLTYINFHSLRNKIKAGAYSLAPTSSAAQIASNITTSSSLGQFTVPEGYTIRQIRAAAEARGIPAAQFDAALAAPYTQAGLSTRPAGVNLEGYLFPDTYEIVPGVTTAGSLVGRMLDTFTTKVGTAYDAGFAAHGLSRHQGLTLASIVEKEVSRPADRPIVAQVFLSRLKQGIPLGSDVTVDYAAAALGTTFNTGLKSPYNTYANAGLPPGPICNPGLSALDAVAKPAATDYLYFLADKTGTTHFAHTFAEHQANIAKYLR